MGYDITYMAMPDSCPLVDWAIQHPSLGDCLGYYHYYVSDLDQLSKAVAQGKEDLKEELEYAEIASNVLRSHPGLENRILHQRRSWDMLSYLLSEARRIRKCDNGMIEYTDLMERAIFGGSIIPGVFAAQGLPIRQLVASEVHDIHLLFQAITQAQFGTFYDIQAMQEAEVMKSWALQEGDDTLNGLWEDFEKLRAFYSDLVAHNEGVIVVID